MTRIERFTSRADAELARSVLQTNGIPAYVSGDDAGGLHPDIPYGIGGTAVVVPDDRYADAIALLDDEFGGDDGDMADLEAAAMAAGPAESSFARPRTPVEPTAARSAGASTRRSGSRRPVFLVVLALMLAATLGAGMLLTILEVFVW